MGWRFDIDKTWAGEVIGARTTALVDAAGVTVDAPFYGQDARPEGHGRHPRLWEHEVVEVFLAEGRDEDSPYVEIEMGPFGHWLVLGFTGYRRQVPLGEVVLGNDTTIDGDRWRGHLKLEPSWWRGILERARFGNAFAIHQRHGVRRFCAAFDSGHTGPPDFHRLDTYRTLRSLGETAHSSCEKDFPED